MNFIKWLQNNLELALDILKALFTEKIKVKRHRKQVVEIDDHIEVPIGLIVVFLVFIGFILRFFGV